MGGRKGKYRKKKRSKETVRRRVLDKIVFLTKYTSTFSFVTFVVSNRVKTVFPLTRLNTFFLQCSFLIASCRVVHVEMYLQNPTIRLYFSLIVVLLEQCSSTSYLPPYSMTYLSVSRCVVRAVIRKIFHSAENHMKGVPC